MSTKKTAEETAPDSLWPALVRAQHKMSGVSHDARNEHQKFNYTSSEAIIKSARQILSSENLVVFVGDCEVRDWPVDGALSYHMTVHLLHGPSGEERIFKRPVPFEAQKGRPWDKAIFGADTTGLAYALRGLLLIDRPDNDDDVSGRDDDGYDPRGRQSERQQPGHIAAIRAASAEYGWTVDQAPAVFAHFGVSSVDDFSATQTPAVLAILRMGPKAGLASIQQPKTDPEPKSGNKRSPADIFADALMQYAKPGGWCDDNGKVVKSRISALKAYVASKHPGNEFAQANSMAKFLKDGWALLQDNLEAELQMAEQASSNPSDEGPPFNFGA